MTAGRSSFYIRALQRAECDLRGNLPESPATENPGRRRTAEVTDTQGAVGERTMATKSAKLHPNEKTKLGPRAGQIQAAGSARRDHLPRHRAWCSASCRGDSMSRFFHSYLVGYTYWLSIRVRRPVVRAAPPSGERPLERHRPPDRRVPHRPVRGCCWVLGLVIALPILLGNESLYLWSKAEMAHDHLIHKKEAWLNSTFFPIRIIFYLVVMTAMAMYFRNKSIEMDKGGRHELGDTLRRASAPAMIVFSLVLAFIGFDLLMSLEPRWFSTMFGVYYFAGAGVGAPTRCSR